VFVEKPVDIHLDSGIGPLVNGNPGGGVEYENVANPIPDIGCLQHFLYISGDIDEFRSGSTR